MVNEKSEGNWLLKRLMQEFFHFKPKALFFGKQPLNFRNLPDTYFGPPYTIIKECHLFTGQSRRKIVHSYVLLPSKE
jgi:hypothetical protein